MRRGKFVIKQTGGTGNIPNQWYWHLKAGNGEIIAVSELYTSRAAAKNGIRSVRINAPFAKVVELEREILHG